MMMNGFKDRKKHFMEVLERDLKIGRVDLDILPLLRLINSLDEYYTTSSCSGRIQIYEAKLPGLKFSIKMLGKWHSQVSADTIIKIIEEKKPKNLWFAVLPPILHVMAKTIDDANKLLHLAREAGFKHSGILSIKPERIIIELTSTERMELPLIINGEWIIRKEMIPKLVDKANELLTITKSKIEKFMKLIQENFKVKNIKNEVKNNKGG